MKNYRKLNFNNIAALPTGKETSSSATKPPKATPKAHQIVFKDKREAMEAFKELLREKNVPASANWYVPRIKDKALIYFSIFESSKYPVHTQAILPQWDILI